MTGKPHLQPRALGLGLAGGLLGELVLAGAIRIMRGLVVTGDGISPGEELARTVLRQIGSDGTISRPGTGCCSWPVPPPEDIARRLGHAGYLTRATGRRFSRSHAGCRPTRTARSRRWCG